MKLLTKINRLLTMTSKVVLLSACTLSSCTKEADNDTQSEVKIGSAKIQIDCHGDVIANLSAIVTVSSIFDHTFICDDIKLTSDGNDSFFGDIELETPKAIAILMLLDDTTRYAVGYVELSQEMPLKISFTLQNGKVTKIEKSDENGVNSVPFRTSEGGEDTVLADAAYIVASPGSWTVPGRPRFSENDFTDCETATEKLDSLRTYILACALRGREVPTALNPWFETHLQNLIYGDYYLGYRDNFDIGDNVMPLYFFQFLNDIDYRQLLTHNPITGPNYLMRKLLKSPDFGLKPIGETVVEEWQADARISLGRVMDKIPQLLLDLLSATSYVEQINGNRPLTPKQIENLKSGYKDDLGILVLKKNEHLLEILNKDVNKRDLSKEDFVLKKYIDEYFPGQPVMIDTWNTWCIPCMEAHKKVAPLREREQSQGVVFLYISDVTSPKEEWVVKVPEIGGYHVRINESSRDLMGQTYSLEAFPSYLFFDKEHNLMRTITGYPGDASFMKYIGEINSEI